MPAYIMVFVLGVVVGILVLSLLSFVLKPKPPETKNDPTTLSVSQVNKLSRLPASSKYHGGSREQVIKIERAPYLEELVKQVRWEANYAGFDEVDFATISFLDPSKVIVGYTYKVGDEVDGQIVVHTDGLTVSLMPPKQAMAFMHDTLADLEAKKKSPDFKRLAAGKSSDELLRDLLGEGLKTNTANVERRPARDTSRTPTFTQA